MGDVAQPVGRSALGADGIHDVLPWAHVSISRAVANERAPMGGPYHGTRVGGIKQLERGQELAAAVAPPRQQVGRAHAPARLDGHVHSTGQQNLHARA